MTTPLLSTAWRQRLKPLSEAERKALRDSFSAVGKAATARQIGLSSQVLNGMLTSNPPTNLSDVSRHKLTRWMESLR